MLRVLKHILIVFAGLAVFLPQITVAQIQENRPPFVDQNVRLPVELQPEAFQYKGFKYLPQLTLTWQYDSNLFVSNNDEIGDYSLTATPQITISKEYDRFQGVLNLQGDFERFTTETSENKDNLSVEFEGDFYANSRWAFPLNVSYFKTILERSSPIGNLLTSKEPFDLNIVTANAGVMRRFNRLSITLLGEYSDIAYQNGVSKQNNTPIILDDNDRSTMVGNLGFQYEFLRDKRTDSDPEHYIFGNVKLGTQDYKRRAFSNGSYTGVTRDRDTLSALIGFKTGYKGILNAQIGAGILNQYFEEPTLDDTSTYDVFADIQFAATEKATLQFLVGRDISQDNDILQGIVLTEYNLGLDYELQHNLYSSLNVGYTHSEFKGVSREDDEYTASLELKYYLNPRYSAKASVSHVFRNSTERLREYDRNIFMLSLTGRL